MLIELVFFSFLFPSYCYSLGLRIASIDRAFLRCPRVIISIRQHCLQCWQFVLLPSFSILTVCQRHLRDVMAYAWSLVFSFFGPFAKVLLWSTLKRFLLLLLLFSVIPLTSNSGFQSNPRYSKVYQFYKIILSIIADLNFSDLCLFCLYIDIFFQSFIGNAVCALPILLLSIYCS